MDWANAIQEFESKIRQGQGAEVKKSLGEISIQQVPRKHYLQICNIAVRAGLPDFALRLLDLEIKKDGFDRARLSVAEKAEYCGALVALGAYLEAHKILSAIPLDEYPRSYLYSAFALFNQWEYLEAVPHLNLFLSRNTDPYMDRVGRVNLCAALIFSQKFTEALDILLVLKKELQQSQQFFLLGNVHELMSQCYLGLQEYDRCRTVLEQAQTLLERNGSYFDLFVKKWRAVLDLTENPSYSNLDSVRVQAVHLGHTETLRECDFFEGIIQEKDDLIRKVYFGSPFKSYRRKITDAVGLNKVQGDQFKWNLSGAASKNIIRADIPVGLIAPNSILHNLQKIIFSDFYSSWRIATLFSKLFADEHYNVNSSNNRIFQLVHRWNTSAEESNTPLRIVSSNNSFRITATDDCSILVSREFKIESPLEAQLRILREHFQTQDFTAGEARTLLQKSQSHTSELLSSAQKDLGLCKIGSGRSTKYRFSA